MAKSCLGRKRETSRKMVFCPPPSPRLKGSRMDQLLCLEQIDERAKHFFDNFWFELVFRIPFDESKQKESQMKSLRVNEVKKFLFEFADHDEKAKTRKIVESCIQSWFLSFLHSDLCVIKKNDSFS